MTGSCNDRHRSSAPPARSSTCPDHPRAAIHCERLVDRSGRGSGHRHRSGACVSLSERRQRAADRKIATTARRGRTSAISSGVNSPTPGSRLHFRGAERDVSADRLRARTATGAFDVIVSRTIAVTGYVAPALIMDQPSAGASVSQPFVVRGGRSIRRQVLEPAWMPSTAYAFRAAARRPLACINVWHVAPRHRQHLRQSVHEFRVWRR